ncbi:hypothetical protein [Parasphingorhabdus pacifica]
MLSKLGKKPGVFGVAALLAAAPLLAAPMAQAVNDPAAQERDEAAKALLICDLDGRAEFTPALGPALPGNAPQTTMTIEGEATSCSGESDVVSAKFTGSFQSALSCTSLPNDTEGEATITWTHEDGTTSESTADFALTFDQLNSGHFGGEITEGEFVGNESSGTAEIDLLGAGAACATGAATGGVDALEFSGKYQMTN